MDRLSSCPDAQQWQQLLLGFLPEDEMKVLGQHLAQCSQCLQTVRTAQAQDVLVQALRSGPASGKDIPEDSLSRLIQRVKRLWPAARGTPPLAETVPAADGPEQPSAADSPAALAVGPGTAVPQEIYDFLSAAQTPEELGRLGPYRILKVLGAGGMGVVFQAEDTQLQRLVALKALRPGLAAIEAARRRFLREARAIAAVEHDHIVPIYQVGEDRNVPFLVMPLLHGESLEECLLRQGQLPVAEVLRVGREMAEGLAAAHERGLIHRDVKPANVWLAGPRRRVKLLDFGLVRVVQSDVQLTQQGAIPGTPAYMAPEQAQGQSVDARCDLFSLGCVLYRACTGRTAFKGASSTAVLLALVQYQPPAPHVLNSEVPLGLSELVMALLCKEPSGRPASARVVAEALEGLEGTQEVVQPQPTATAAATVPARLGPRRRAGLVIAAAVLLAGVLWWGATLVLRTAQGTLTVTTAEPDVQVYVDGQERITIDSRKVGKIELVPGEHQLSIRRGGEELLTDSFTLKSGGEVVVAARWQPRGAGQEAAALPTASPFDRLEAAQIPAEVRAGLPPEVVAVVGDSRLMHWNRVQAVAFSPDGKVLASAGQDGMVRLWDPTTGRSVRTIPAHSLRANAVAFSADGKYLAVGTTDSIWLWDTATWQEPRRLQGHKREVRGVAFGPGGRLASASYDGTVRVWKVNSAKELLMLPERPERVFSVAWDPKDGRLLAFGGADGTLRVWDVAAGKELRAWEAGQGAICAVAWSQDGKALASAGDKGTVKVWEATTGKEVHVLDHGAKGSGPVFAVAFNPDDRTLVSGGLDGAVRLWGRESGRQEDSLHGHGGPVYCVAFSPDGKLLATGSAWHAVKLWRVRTRTELNFSRTQGGFMAATAVLPDGRLMAAGPHYDAIRLWDIPSNQIVRTLTGETGTSMRYCPWSSVDLSPGGQWLLCNGMDGVRLWETASGRELRTLAPGVFGGPAAFSRGAGRLVAAATSNRLGVWEGGTGREIFRKKTPDRNAVLLAFSPDERMLAVSFRSQKEVKLYDTATGQEGPSLSQKTGELYALAWSPDGKMLATGGQWPCQVQLWDVATAQVVHTLIGHELFVSAAAFSSDGTMIASAGWDGTVRLWDVHKGTELRKISLAPPEAKIVRIDFAPDGRHLLTSNGDGTLYVLRLAPPPDQGPR